MKLANGAIIMGLDINMRPALLAADEIYKRHGQELTITCGLNGEHSAGSLHPYGRAVDLRTSFFGDEQKKVVAGELKAVLGRTFDVVLEASHIHIEYDPK